MLENLLQRLEGYPVVIFNANRLLAQKALSKLMILRKLVTYGVFVFSFRRYKKCSVSLILGFIPLFAHGSTGGVFGAVVTEQTQSAQYRFSLDDNEAVLHRFHVQKAFSDSSQGRFVIQYKGTNLFGTHKSDFVQAEYLKEISQTKDYASGLRLDLSRNRNGTLKFGVNWIHQWFVSDSTEVRFIMLSSSQRGADASRGISLQTRSSYIRKTANLQFGVEVFNNIGSISEGLPRFNEQNNSIGPFLTMPFTRSSKTSLYISSQFGITSSAPDYALRIWLNHKF